MCRPYPARTTAYIVRTKSTPHLLHTCWWQHTITTTAKALRSFRNFCSVYEPYMKVITSCRCNTKGYNENQCIYICVIFVCCGCVRPQSFHGFALLDTCWFFWIRFIVVNNHIYYVVCKQRPYRLDLVVLSCGLACNYEV